MSRLFSVSAGNLRWALLSFLYATSSAADKCRFLTATSSDFLQMGVAQAKGLPSLVRRGARTRG